MAAETENTLSKVDSLVEEAPAKKGHRRGSSLHANVFTLGEIRRWEEEKEENRVKIPIETQSLNWKLNTSPATLDDKETLKKLLCKPMAKKIDLHFELGLHVTARNLKGVTVKDALDAIHKQFKKKADDELDLPFLAGFEWIPEVDNEHFLVHRKQEGAPQSSKKKKKGGDE